MSGHDAANALYLLLIFIDVVLYYYLNTIISIRLYFDQFWNI